MKVRVQLTADVSEVDRNMIAIHLDKGKYTERKATLAEMREFYRTYGTITGRRLLDSMIELRAHRESLREVA